MKILLISHGTIAKGIYEALQMIVGNVENTHYICLDKDKSIKEFKEELKIKINEFIDEKIVILSDIKGGSPYMTSIDLLNEFNILEKSIIISGLNLPLAALVCMEEDINSDEIDAMIEESRESIEKFEIVTIEEDEDM